jgi:hypothetical protein
MCDKHITVTTASYTLMKLLPQMREEQSSADGKEQYLTL